MSLESQHRAPDGCQPLHPESPALRPGDRLGRYVSSMEELLAELARPPGSRWGPVVTVVGAVLLLVAGADITVWRTREPARVASLESEALPLTLEMGARYEIPVPGLRRVAVGNPDIVDVKVVGGETLRVEPVSAGTTPMLVWTGEDSRRVYTVSVRSR